jgi:hypothetical protein
LLLRNERENLMNQGQIQLAACGVNEDMPHWVSGGKDRALRDGVNASMQLCPGELLKNARIVKLVNAPLVELRRVCPGWNNTG